jgi:hypothetical protein
MTLIMITEVSVGEYIPMVLEATEAYPVNTTATDYMFSDEPEAMEYMPMKLLAEDSV